MPRKQDFSNSVIYHIRNKETKHVIYVGSTTNFQQRKITHKFCYNNEKHKEYNKSCYVFIRENEGWDFYEVIPIEFLKLENKTQLAIAEQVEIDKQYNLKNNRKSHRTEENKKEYMKEYLKEYMKENKEKIAEKHKEYYEENKEEINKKSRQYHKENKETIAEKHKEYMKEYRKKYSETCKEEIKEKKKEYYEENKEEINKKRRQYSKEIIECPICNSKSTIGHLKRHQLSIKCKSFIHRPYPL